MHFNIWVMLLIVHQCFLMTLSPKLIVFKPTLQTTNKFFFSWASFVFKEDIGRNVVIVTQAKMDAMKVVSISENMFMDILLFLWNEKSAPETVKVFLNDPRYTYMREEVYSHCHSLCLRYSLQFSAFYFHLNWLL